MLLVLGDATLLSPALLSPAVPGAQRATREVRASSACSVKGTLADEFQCLSRGALGKYFQF